VTLISNFEYHGHICISFPLFGLSLYEFIKKNRFKVNLFLKSVCVCMTEFRNRVSAVDWFRRLDFNFLRALLGCTITR
jgi:hypothetical protein